MDRPAIEGGTLTIAGDRIVAVEPPGKARVDLDLGDVAVLPGLVNAHTHLDLGALRGRLPPSRFTDWLRAVVAYRRSSTAAEWAPAIRAGIDESLRNGTTLVGDIAFAGTSGPILTASPLRAVAFYELIGLKRSRAEQVLQEADRWLARQHRTASYRFGLSPHAPYTVSRYLMEEAVRRAQLVHLPLAVHFTETSEEGSLLLFRTGPLRAFLEELGAWDESDLFSSLTEPLLCAAEGRPGLLIHGNGLSPPGFPGVSIVYCPRTHAYFGRPPHPFAELQAAGMNVALGTDSLASNPDLSILEEMRFLHRRRPEVDGEQIVRMGTVCGAQALGWEVQTGTLTPGKLADWIAVPIEAAGRGPCDLLLEGDRSPSRVCIRGLEIPRE